MGTHVEEQGWFSRIGGAFKGLLVGGILTIVSVPLLFWNEGRAVRTAKGLKEGASLVIDIQPDSVDAANEGKFVHTGGEVATTEVLRDEPFGLEYNGIRLTRHVEMFQWEEDSDTRTEKKVGGGERRITTYTYRKDWFPGVIDSTGFDEANSHRNPTDSLFTSRSVQAKEVDLGKFRLSDSLIGMIHTTEPIQLTRENLPAEAPGNLQVRQDGPQGSSRIYIARSASPQKDAAPGDALEPAANPDRPELVDLENSTEAGGSQDESQAAEIQLASAPEIGDVRVWFSATPVTTVSLLSQQAGDTFQPFQTSYGTTINVLREGTHSAAEMIAQEEANNRMLTWLLRGVGTFVMFLGFSMLLRPLVVLADVIPMFGSLVGFGTAIVAGLLTIAGSMTVIAVAWVFYRPLLGITLFAIAAVALYMIYQRSKNQSSPGARSQPETLGESDLV